MQGPKFKPQYCEEKTKSQWSLEGFPQLGKCLLCTREDLSFNPQALGKSDLREQCHVPVVRAGRRRPDDRWG